MLPTTESAMRTVLYDGTLTSPRVSFILVDWNCRESFHALDYLARQDVPRSEYEVIWIEYYDRRAGEIDRRVAAAEAKAEPPPVDNWIVMEMPSDVYYHKHLMYNVGIFQARGQIIVICDSDAMFEPSFVRTVTEAFAADPDMVLHIDEVRSA
jgi:cellulose synthase/poly-beta-1,6-N-acetylglucosamine synthase-like glycosyltransferase